MADGTAPLAFSTGGKRVGAVAAAIDILKFLGVAGEPVRLVQITRTLGVNASTALNILRTLEQDRLVRFDARSKLYALDMGLADLAAPLLDSGERRLRAAMEGAAQDLGVTVALWKRVGDQVELVSVEESADTMRIAFVVGRRLPMLLGAMGRLIAARSGLSEAELADQFSRVEWARPPAYDAWRADVAAVARDGFAIDRGHVSRGVLSLAVPVEPQGALTRVCCATMFEAEDDGALARVVERLKEIAALVRGQDKNG